MWCLLGIVLSAGWLAVAYWWFDGNVGLDNWSYVLAPEVVGQYVAGLLAPLILIWVLMGFLRGPRGMRRLRDELALLRDDLAEREQRSITRARPDNAVDSPLLAPRRHPEAVAPLTPTLTPTLTPAPRAPSPPTLLTPVATPLPPAPPAAPLMAAPAVTAAPTPAESGASVTSLAQEVARTLGRLANEPVAPASLDNEAALDEDFRLLIHKVGRDLNAICMDLSAVLCRKPARDEALKAYNRGHKDAFHVLVRDFLAHHDSAEVMGRLTQADAASLLHTYAMKFASLIDEAARRDASGVQEQALRAGPMGQLYEEVQRHTQIARSTARP